MLIFEFKKPNKKNNNVKKVVNKTHVIEIFPVGVDYHYKITSLVDQEKQPYFSCLFDEKRNS